MVIAPLSRRRNSKGGNIVLWLLGEVVVSYALKVQCVFSSRVTVSVA
jgi:hypothetical protein